MDKKLYNKKELAAAFGVNPRTIYRYRRLGMPHIQLGKRSVRYDFDECLAWAKSLSEKYDIPNLSVSPSQEIS